MPATKGCKNLPIPGYEFECNTVKLMCDMIINYYSDVAISRLMVVSHEAKKEHSKLPKTKPTTNYHVFFTRANVFVI